MTDWFRSWHGAPIDPKWLGIGKRVGVAPGIVAAVVWALMDRASQADERGSIEGYDAEGLAAFFGCEEEHVNGIVAAMTDRGMIVGGRFKSWEKRQPKREDGSAERAKEWRERQRTQANAAKRPDTETEKIQKGEGSNEPSCSEPEVAPSVVVSLPTVSDGEVSITEADVAEWQPAFPAVNVRQQLAAMRQWLLANPTKRKTKRGLRKFVVSWLDRKQNSGSPPQPHAASPPSQPRQPRNVGELSLMQMDRANGQSSSTDIGRLDAGDGRRQAGGVGSVREIALGSDEYRRA